LTPSGSALILRGLADAPTRAPPRLEHDMAPRTADEIRSAFLQFFHERGHAIVKSSSLVPQNDPTLLFTNSGMVQFKDVFTGKEKREYTRATSSQRCVRAGGKHNDLENVGFTARHHTFFEMLGNFSFGDYFKPDAIQWGWEFVTQVLGLPADKLVVTIFKGEDGVPADEEAAELWKAQGVRPERIYRLGKKENFWQMGDTGPCGPCTEIHIYRGDTAKTQAEIDANAKAFFTGPGDTDEWMEIWNLVFMQFERFADGKLIPLPKPSVDTGAGLERMASAVQGAATNYDTDLLQGLCLFIAELAKKSYPSDKEDTASVRVIADHARATSFLIADGVMPSNEGRGYVLRRIMRRAIRHGKRLGLEQIFFDRVCQKVVELMGAAYPELPESATFIREVVRNEEAAFRKTLNRGLQLLEEEFGAMADGAGKTVSGPAVFKLYDTYGFPTDLTRLIAEERGFTIDEPGFEVEMEKQREGSKKFGGTGQAAIGDLYKKVAGEVPPTKFLGYAELNAPGEVLRIVSGGQLVQRVEAPATIEVVFNQTPFYGESGGQVGDQGVLSAEGARGKILDVQKPVSGLFVHKVSLEQGALVVGDEVTLEIDNTRRLSLRANHSATHLLHLALREVLGDHVKQKGSVVAPDYLRFDYAHFAALTDEQIRQVEKRVNQLVRDNYAANTEELPIEEAKKRGAIAFFDEKYGERVRVLTIGPSMELCGGTHVSRSGDVGFFKIKEESAIAAGIRRIVGVTGPEAVALIHDEEATLEKAAAFLKSSPRDLPQKVEAAQARIKELEKELDGFKKAAAAAKSGDLASQAIDVKGVKVLAVRAPDNDAKSLRDLADKLRDKLGNGVIALGAETEGKVTLLVAVTKELSAKLSAKVIVDELNKTLGGRGGGKPDLVQSGGGDPAKLDATLAQVAGIVEARV
jgi:alanyl-tRNA synthetase